MSRWIGWLVVPSAGRDLPLLLGVSPAKHPGFISINKLRRSFCDVQPRLLVVYGPPRMGRFWAFQQTPKTKERALWIRWGLV